MIVKIAVDIMKSLPRCWEKPSPVDKIIEKKYLDALEEPDCIQHTAGGYRLTEFGEYILAYLEQCPGQLKDFEEVVVFAIGDLAADTHVGDASLREHDLVNSAKELLEVSDELANLAKRYPNKKPAHAVTKCNKICFTKHFNRCNKMKHPPVPDGDVEDNDPIKGSVLVTKVGPVKLNNDQDLYNKLTAVMGGEASWEEYIS